MNGYGIKHYISSDGKNFFLTWLKQLSDPIAKVQVLRRINRLESGNFGDHKFCRDGVWELRIDTGGGQRIYYALVESNVVLLLCAGGKSSQSKDISKAVEYWADWQRRSLDER